MYNYCKMLKCNMLAFKTGGCILSKKKCCPYKRKVIILSKLIFVGKKLNSIALQ